MDNAAERSGVSTRVIMWLAGAQDVRIDVTHCGTPQARLTLAWEVAHLGFTAADQVAMMADEVRESHGVGVVLPEVVSPRLIHGAPEDMGPLPVAVVTFHEPKTVQAIPGGTGRGRWVDLQTGYLYLRITDRRGLRSLTDILNRAETLAAAALPATSTPRRTRTH